MKSSGWAEAAESVSSGKLDKLVTPKELKNHHKQLPDRLYAVHLSANKSSAYEQKYSVAVMWSSSGDIVRERWFGG